MTSVAIIEDDPALLDLVRELLKERSWGTLMVQDRYTAVETIRREVPDAVLLDIHLGGAQNGWHMLDALRADPVTRTIPIIVWSGDARGLQEKEQWLREHRIGVLSKPFDIDDLYRCLDQELESQSEATG